MIFLKIENKSVLSVIECCFHGCVFRGRFVTALLLFSSLWYGKLCKLKACTTSHTTDS